MPLPMPVVIGAEEGGGAPPAYFFRSRVASSMAHGAPSGKGSRESPFLPLFFPYADGVNGNLDIFLLSLISGRLRMLGELAAHGRVFGEFKTIPLHCLVPSKLGIAWPVITGKL